MSLPALLEQRLRLPVVAAPMFLVSNPQLVQACCNSGIVGSFPALNQRDSSGFKDWLQEIDAGLDRRVANGKLTQAEADAKLAEAKVRIDKAMTKRWGK